MDETIPAMKEVAAHIIAIQESEITILALIVVAALVALAIFSASSRKETNAKPPTQTEPDRAANALQARNELNALNLDSVEQVLKASRRYVDGPEVRKFLDGARVAFGPIKAFVKAMKGEALGFGDTLSYYAMETRETAEDRLKSFELLASQMEGASAAGVRYIAALLVLDYFPFPDSEMTDIPRYLKLQEESISILEKTSNL